MQTTMKASTFKARCLKLMDEINDSGDEIVITKHGKPVSILTPYTRKRKDLFGLHQGQVETLDDLISPVNEQWDAEN